MGDFLDPLVGFDWKVTITQTPGKQYPDTTVDAARRPSKLMEDPAQIEKLLASTPNLDDMYRQKSKEAQPASAPVEEPKKQSKKKVAASDDDDDAPKKKQTLDDAFNELMETLRG